MTTATATSTLLPASHRTVPSTENYVVKGFVEHETSRGVYMSGNLYRGSKKVAIIEEEGRGGEPTIQFLFGTKSNDITDAQREARAEETRRFHTWVQKWATQNPGGLWGFGNDAPVEDVLFVLLDEAGRLRDLNRGKGLNVLTPDEVKAGEKVRRFDGVDLGRAVHRQQLCEQVGADALYWDKTAKTWKKVADARG